MTTIAWDGKTLASDTRCNSGNIKLKISKIRKHKGHLVAWAGPCSHGEEMFAWWKAGAKPKDFPDSQLNDDDRVDFVVVTPERKVFLWQGAAYPQDMSLNKQYAIGSGRDFALAAMYLGKTAPEAVELAGRFDTGTDSDGVEFICLK